MHSRSAVAAYVCACVRSSSLSVPDLWVRLRWWPPGPGRRAWKRRASSCSGTTPSRASRPATGWGGCRGLRATTTRRVGKSLKAPWACRRRQSAGEHNGEPTEPRESRSRGTEALGSRERAAYGDDARGFGKVLRKQRYRQFGERSRTLHGTSSKHVRVALKVDRTSMCDYYVCMCGVLAESLHR